MFIVETKALISGFVFAYAKIRFSHDAAQLCFQLKRTTEKYHFFSLKIEDKKCSIFHRRVRVIMKCNLQETYHTFSSFSSFRLK